MDPALLLENLRTPAILFFALGLFAAVVRSDLAIPEPVSKILSIYLLAAIGLHGGHELAASPLNGQILGLLGVAILMSAAVPIWSFFVLRLRVDAYNAAAIAATYGSISAVTFITAQNFLSSLDSGDPQMVPGGYMVAAMALMESPAIIVGVLLARVFTPQAERQADGPSGSYTNPPTGRGSGIDWRELLREACLTGAVVTLVGSLLIGTAISDAGWSSIKPLMYDPFKGVLCLFLLDIGLLAGRRLKDLRRSGPFLIGFAILSAPIHAALGIAAGYLLGASPADTLLLAVLTGSASYIAAPAAMRLAIPQANASFYIPMSLALTFPFNITVGIPLYLAVIRWLWNA